MARRQQSVASPTTNNEPKYEWAIDLSGYPIHISQAERGGTYSCPVCHGKMIAKLGEIKQHHFAHDDLQVCTPEYVARVAARRWLALELHRILETRQHVNITWPCPLCQHEHTANLLHNIAAVSENHMHDDMVSDLALLDARGTLRAAILLARPSQEVLIAYAVQKIMTIVIDSGKRLTLNGLEDFLAGARIYGGICTTQRSAAEDGVITDERQLRRLLTDAVSRPPHNLYGALEKHGGLTHVLVLDNHKLWLPPILWQRAIGGLHHAINPALQIISQEWSQPDGATIALYYVTANATSAVSVRRFPPGQAVYARLNPGVLHNPRMTALAVARSFAEV